MGANRVNTESTNQILLRFFEAVKTLKALRKIRSQDEYCAIIGINPSNFRRQKRNLSSASFQVSWMAPLVEKFGVSPDWLLTGRGEMFIHPSFAQKETIKHFKNAKRKQPSPSSPV